MWFLALSVQGCGATCCVHLPGPNHLWPKWEWALPSSGARTGCTLLRGWTHPEVTGTHTHMHAYRCAMKHFSERKIFTPNVFQYLSFWQCVCGCSLSNASCYFSSKGEECDDMNSLNGDGCSSQCRKEPFFNCVGKSYGQRHHHLERVEQSTQLIKSCFILTDFVWKEELLKKWKKKKH